MFAVYKYPLALTDADSVVRMPPNAHVLSAHCQGDTLCVWALVDADAEATDARTFRIHGTGHPIKSVEQLSYIGTAMMHGEAFVWHVFEVMNN